MLFTPNSIQVQEIVENIKKIGPVKNVHHIWQLNEDEVHLEAHIDFSKDIRLSWFDVILEEIKEKLFHNHCINHVNIQPEFGKSDNKQIIVQE
jgi:cobalt-zinc-cadmium efflux system protein